MPTNLPCKIELKGLDKYFDKLKRLGADIDKIAVKAVTESAEPVYEDVKAYTEKHQWTGAAYKSVKKPKEAKDDAGYVYAEVGVKSTPEHPDAWHIVFVEYGTPRAPADPGIREAFNRNKAKVKRIQKKILNDEIEKLGGGRPF